MKLSYTNLIFLLAFQQINCSSTATTPDPPEPQDIPRLITPEERDSLLALIKGDKHQDIVEFFNKNDLIDFPLIRFKSGDDNNGYTPLAAAIRACSMNTAKVLAPLQLSYPWTTSLAPRHSLVEIAAKHCPKLLVEVLKADKTKKHPLHKMIEDVDITQLTAIQLTISDPSSKIDKADSADITNWVASRFDLKLEDQYQDVFKGHPSPADKKQKQDSPKSLREFKYFVQTWIRSGRDLQILLKFIKERIAKISTQMVTSATIEFAKSGKIKEFLEALKELDSYPTSKNIAITSASNYLETAQFASLDDSLKDELRKINEPLDLESQFDLLQALTSHFIDSTGDMQTYFLKKISPDIGIRIAQYFSEDALIRVFKKRMPDIYGHFIQKHPRIDIAVELWPLDPAKTSVLWTGTDKSIDSETGFAGLTKDLVTAYQADDANVLKNLLTVKYKWDKINYDELRFKFAPYKLSLVKTAVMLKKTEILKYLMSLPDASLYLTSKHQLTAIEMAACYQPDFFIEKFLPMFAGKCHKRLRAANNLIAMFRETSFQKCPTGAQNAPKILPKLLASSKADEISCIDFTKKDAIEEAFKYNFPAQLIRALHATGKYKNTEFYIELSVKHGNIDLFLYFESQKKADEPSPAIEESLANWARHTNGIMNDQNVEMLEFLLSHKDVNVNAKLRDSGVSALSLATQRSLLWVVKRLLLQKDLDVNSTDLNTLTTPIQHSINIFRIQNGEVDHSNDHWIVQGALLVAKDARINLPEDSIQAFGEFADSIEKTKFDWKEYKTNLMDLDAALGKLSKITKGNFSDLTALDDLATLVNLFGLGDLNLTSIGGDISGLKAYLGLASLDVLGPLGGEIKAIFNQLDIAIDKITKIVKTLKINEFIKELNDKTYLEAIPVYLEIIDHLEANMNFIKDQLEDPFIMGALEKLFTSKGIDFDKNMFTIGSVKFMVAYFKAVCQEGLEKFNGTLNANIDSQKGMVSPLNGLLHNVLLSHPSIDTTVENVANIDTLYITKLRATYLAGDDDGINEMARTHVRVCNIDAVHDSKKNVKRAIFGVVSTLAVGSATYGVIRWIMSQ